MSKIFIFILTIIVSITAQAQITHEQFLQISKSFHDEFSQELAKDQAILIINPPPSPQLPNFWWDRDEEHASYSGYTKDGVKQHMIFIFGGYARIPGMTPDGVAMTLCHELGHGIGGAPYKDRGPYEQSSTEGQSDYFAARLCLRRMFKHIPEFQKVEPPTPYTDALCRSRFSNSQDLYDCHRAFQALEVERLYFRRHLATPEETNYETPDPTIADSVNRGSTYYPSSQCRLDTMMAGILMQERPRCWFVEN